MPARAQDADTQTLQAGLNACSTLQAIKVTFVGVARQLGVEGVIDLGPETVRFLRASQCQDEAHYHLFLQLGATAIAPAFAMPPGTLVGREAFLRTLTELEGIAVGASMAMTRLFAEYADFNLVETAFQIGTVDAQHEALARYLLGARPANDRAFAKWRYFDLLEVEDAVFGTGFLDESDEVVAFPGPVPRNCEGVFGLVPETTDDALSLLPPVTPVGTPNAQEG